MPTSDEDLQTLRDEVQDLRVEVSEAESDRLAAQQQLSNDLTAADLKAERARLQSQLAGIQAEAQKTDEDIVGGPLQAAEDAVRLAEAQEAGRQALAEADAANEAAARGDGPVPENQDVPVTAPGSDEPVYETPPVQEDVPAPGDRPADATAGDTPADTTAETPAADTPADQSSDGAAAGDQPVENNENGS